MERHKGIDDRGGGERGACDRALTALVKARALSMGFSAVGVSDLDLAAAGRRLEDWLARGFHGEMAYMTAHGEKRYRPESLVPGSIRCLSVAVDYRPQSAAAMQATLLDPDAAYVSRYALGRDYHKYLRVKLRNLASWIEERYGAFGYRAFTDSAPLMEKPLAHKAGLGWIGKNANLIDRERGSWFFIGELLTDLPLALDEPPADRCGSCTACIEACPTGAIVEPYVVDARKCISYLTIEYKGVIPEPLRPLIGNRAFGCDDCQLCCPWNRKSPRTDHDAFLSRDGLDRATLVELFRWSEEEFERNTRGSPLRRAGYECWLRNLAVALGNAAPSRTAAAALKERRDHPSELVRVHVRWALRRHARGSGERGAMRARA